MKVKNNNLLKIKIKHYNQIIFSYNVSKFKNNFKKNR